MAEGYDPDLDYEIDYEENEDYPSEGQTKDEKIELKPLDDWEQKDGFVKPPEEETSLTLPEAPGTIESPALKEKIKSFYKYLDDNGYRANKDAPLENNATFELSPGKALSVNYKGKTIWLTLRKDSNKFYTPKTIHAQYGKGGTQFVRDVLGIKNWNNPIEKMPPEAEASLAKTSETIASTNSSPERSEDIEMQTIETVEENLTNFLEASAQTELELGPPGSLPFRELAGLDRSLRNMRTTVLKTD